MNIRLICLIVASCLWGCSGSTHTSPQNTSDANSEQQQDGSSGEDTHRGPDATADAASPGDDTDDTNGADADATPNPDEPDAEVPPPPIDCEQYRERANLGSPEASASWKWGGGAGYPDALAPAAECSTMVSTLSELTGALENASPGDIVYVEDGARIDLSDQTLCIPEGVWLAGGRGAGERAGATLYSTRKVSTPVLKICGDDARITGLRIIGPDPDQCPTEWPDNCVGPGNGINCAYCTPPAAGILSDGWDGTEIDNNELSDWGYAATKFGAGERLHLHHNHIHHTQRKGLGYGAVLGAPKDKIGAVLIEWNRFNYNRHAVAGSGANGQSYTARNNLVLEKANGHVFDMHGENERVGDGSDGAGDEILIHDNIVLVPNYYAMLIRGRPARGAWLFDNCLVRNSAAEAARQSQFTGHFYVDEGPNGPAPNRYGQSATTCTTQYLCRASAGEAPWTHLKESSHSTESLRLGDFDGDGKTDVFRAQNGRWEWARSGSDAWALLNTSSYTADALYFADFDGDGKTDIFRASGSEWQISSGGTGSWQTLRSSTKRLGELAFGDFNGDGKTDVFYADGSHWKFSSGGTEPWETLRSSTLGVSQIGFGDFDGDGRTDVFEATGSNWRFYPGGAGAAQELTTSGYTLSGLRLAEIDGDGKTDVLRSDGSRWWVSRGGATSWKALRTTDLDIKKMRFGDFDGDGIPDAFRGRCL